MDDFERRRELRRQKRDEMRVEVDRVTNARNDDDEEEAAKERRRRARQERQRLQKDDVDGNEVNSQNSVSVETRTTSITNTELSTDDEAALLERLARREERRQKRLKEAMERQKEYDPTISITTNESSSFSMSTRNGETKVQENDVTPKENNSEPIQDKHEAEEIEKVEEVVEKNDRKEEEEEQEEEVETKVEVQEEVQEEEEEETPEEPAVEENQDEKPKGGKEELITGWERKKGFPETKVQNGEHEATPQKLKHLDKFGGLKGQPSADEADSAKLKPKQSAAELEDLKKRREERKRLQEEEEQRKKQEEAERKAREEQEKKRMKEDIERRRAEAAEKRQKVPEDSSADDKKRFTPKASPLKIEERAEFLNRSNQKSVKSPQPAAVSKIDSRLEQYTSAIGNNKSAKPVKAAPSDLPLQTEGVRNIKSMWEKGNVFSSPGTAVSPNRETAGLKIGVSNRINEWLTKTPETNKTPSSKPADLRPGDVSGKRNLWERQPEKASTPAK